MFMNCAPIMVLGGNTPPNVPYDEHMRQWEKQPRIFEANNGNGCWTANKGSCVQFPEPGESLEVNPECPVLPDQMFTGNCAHPKSMATKVSLADRVRDRPFLSSFAILVACLLIASIGKVVISSKKRGVRYRKIPV